MWILQDFNWNYQNLQHSFCTSYITKHNCEFITSYKDSGVGSKRNCTIHIPSHILLLEPPARASCFSFEFTHNYFKELVHQQNFKSLPVPLAKRHQQVECCNFISNYMVPSLILCFQLKEKLTLMNHMVLIKFLTCKTNLRRLACFLEILHVAT